MKIWLINHYAADMYRDKAGRHYWFAKKLIDRGNTVSIICASAYLNGNNQLIADNAKYMVKHEEDIDFAFVRTIPAAGNGVKRVLNMFLFYHNLLQTWKRIVNETFKPEVIVASSVHPLTLVAGIRIAKKLHIPCVCEVRDLWPEGIFTASGLKERSLVGKLLVAGEHWIYRKADALIFTKEGDTDYLKEHKWTNETGGDIDLRKCHYINNGIDLAQFKNSVEQYKYNNDELDTGKFSVVYTGTIRPTNHVDLILDAAKALSEREDIIFYVFGDGNQVEPLKKRIVDESITNVRMKGRVERKYIPNILSTASINLLNYSPDYTWTRGNSSNKLFEYMASGKPIISTVHMGYSIINKYRCGVELDKCTPEALADAIVRFHDMSSDERQQYGQNAAEGAKDFDFDTLTDKLINVIESVMA